MVPSLLSRQHQRVLTLHEHMNICETLGTVFTTRPLLRGTFGMVSSTHWLASQCGMAVLEKGGNAFDAAVAAGLVLQVVEPHMNGLGGDASILIWSQREQRAHSRSHEYISLGGR